MVDPTPSDEQVAPGGEAPNGPDANGEAAILLVESLIHGLVARSLLTVDDALDIVGDAVDVKEDIAGEIDPPPGVDERALTVLRAIQASLRIDLPVQAVRPWPPRK